MAHDKTVPSFTIPNTKRIKLTITATDASVIDQGYTYNEVGFSYNQATVQYGGVTSTNQDVVPTILTASIKPSLRITASQTDATLTDQGYTYNQANFTYNQTDVLYAGLSQANNDSVPELLTASFITPHIREIEDIYTRVTPVPPSNSGMLMGILGLTYP